MRLIFQLGTSHPRGLNSDFRFLQAARPLQSCYFLFHGVCKPCNISIILVTPLMKGQAQNIWKGTQTIK